LYKGSYFKIYFISWRIFPSRRHAEFISASITGKILKQIQDDACPMMPEFTFSI